MSEAIARAGLQRTESRGAHFREDRPGKDEALARCNLVVRRDDGGMTVRREPVPPMSSEQQAIVAEMK